MTMKQFFFFIQLFCLVLLPLNAVQAADYIDEVEFNDTQLADVVRTLSELTDTNIMSVCLMLLNPSAASAIYGIAMTRIPIPIGL